METSLILIVNFKWIDEKEKLIVFYENNVNFDYCSEYTRITYSKGLWKNNNERYKAIDMTIKYYEDIKNILMDKKNIPSYNMYYLNKYRKKTLKWINMMLEWYKKVKLWIGNNNKVLEEEWYDDIKKADNGIIQAIFILHRYWKKWNRIKRIFF